MGGRLAPTSIRLFEVMSKLANFIHVDDMWLCTDTRTYQARPANFSTITTTDITALESREEVVRRAAAGIIARPRVTAGIADTAVERDNYDDVR